MNHRLALWLRLGLLGVFMAGAVFQPQYSASAAANLTVTPLTWNVIGLDSNSPASGPYRFPVGARVCNSGTTAATNVAVNYVWDSANANINLRAGSLSTITIASLAVGACSDAYFEVEVNQVAAAYDTFRQYHITATDSLGATGSTPIPRALYVEHLISQSRNAITNVQLNGISVPAGGSMNLLVGNTYTIGLFGGTATQGYNQFEAFINFPNTIFQILSVSTTYSANNSPYVSSPNDKLYADACLWENDPNSPNYRACVGGDYKTGGSNVVTTYIIKIISGGGTTQTLNTLLYDFSGSSYHYNADYSTGVRFANIIDPTNVSIAKSFSPNPGNVNGVSALTITLTNPNPGAITGYNFTDPLPANMSVASTPGATTTSCGTPTFAPAAGATSISFSNGTIAASGTCTIKVNVTTTATGTYNNTTNNLFVDTLDTGKSASASLTVNTAPAAPAPICGLTMAQWTFAGFTVNPPPFPAASTQASNVTTAAISVGNGLTANADTTAAGGNLQPGIRLYGWQNAGPIVIATSAYIQFAIDTSQYTQVNMQFDAQRKANGPGNDEVYYSTDGTNWNLKSTFASTTTWTTFGAFNFTGQANTTGITYFRVYGYGANATSSGNDLNIDNVTFTGCATPTPPTITKAFSPNPIAVNGTSTLTFTLSNSNSIALTGVTFTDALPPGLQVASTPTATTTCGGTPTWAPAATATSLTFGSPTGASIPASSSCTVSVTITGTASGAYQNVSGFISSTNGGTNTSSTGSATASLAVIKPPSLAKRFSANPILAGGTSTLTFTLTNPNQNDSLTGLAFTDTFPVAPAAMTVAAPLTTTNTCGGTLQDNGGGALAAGDPGIRLTGGTLTGGSACTVSVNITAATVGSYANTSGAVSSTNGGTGDTAPDTLTVKAPNPAISLLKQVSTSATGPWTSFVAVTTGTNIYYQFTVQNDGDVPLTSVNVTDPLVSAAGCTWRNGDGTLLTAPITLPVASAANNQHYMTCVVGPVTAVAGSHPNTATATGTYSPTNYTDTSTATYATTGVTLAKSAAETSFTAAGDLLHYSYLVTNSGAAPLLGPVTVTDDKIILPNTVVCPAVNSVGDLDNWLDPGESLTCTATYTVTLADITAALVTNTATATISNVTSSPSSVTVYRSLADLTVTKTNNVTGSVAQNGSFDWTITVNNSGIADALFADTNVIVNDTLPGLSTYYPQGALIVTAGFPAPTGGTINCSITLTALSCAASGAVTVPVGGSFSVTFTVTPTVAGSLANTATVDFGGNVLEINETNNTGSDTVMVIAPPSISKSFGAASLAVGSTTTLTFTITNPNATTALTGVAFSDALPAGLTVADSSAAPCGGTLTTTAATSVISLSGATIAGAGTCTFGVTVTASAAGVKNNTTASVTSTNGGAGNTASASTTVVAPPLIVKSFSPSAIVVNGTSTLTFTITNPAANTVALTGVGFTDTYPSGLQNAVVPNASTTCAAGTVTAAANGPSVSLGGATLAVNTSCTVTVTVTGTTAGTKTNSVSVSSTNGGTGNTSTANLGVISATKSVIGTSEDSTSGNNVAIGEIVRYRLVVDLPEGTTTNLQILDNMITNLRYINDGSTRIAFVCNSGAACATSSTASIGSNPVISGNSAVAPTFVLPAATITNNSSGATTSPFPSGDDPLFSLGNITNSDSDADAEYVVIEFNALIANVVANQNSNTRNNTFSVWVGGTTLTTSASVTITIVEPVLTSFTKSITTTPIEAGDTITYQLQFTNSGTSPAFDIVVTDALNTALTTPVTVTGSTTGGACGSTASTVSGSFSAPNATATVTCLAVGGTVTINISATVSSSALAGFTFSNSASLAYTSLPGANGTPNGSGGNATGSSTPGAAGASTGERIGSGGTNDYIATSNTVNTTLASPSLAKTINPSGTTYAIGSTIPYQITIMVPEGVTGNPTANLVDTIPTGLSYVAGSLTVTPQAGVTIGTAGPYTDANATFYNLTGQTLTLNFGSFTSTASGAATNRTILVTFNARVDNLVGNQSGTSLTNSVDFIRTDPNSAGTLTLTATSPTVSVIEPVLAVSKAASTPTPAYNSTLTYTLTVNHIGVSNAPAYDTVITDTLPAGLTGLTNVNATSTAPASCATSVVNNSTTSVLSVTVGSLPLGCAVTITYDVTVSGAVASTQTNSVNTAWTSGSGSVTGERTGADGVGGVLNDYAATTSQPVTISNPDLSVLKTDGSTTYTAGSPIAYTITVNNTGNTTATGTVTDTFPAALTSITWTCAGTGAATCGASGSGNISDAVSIPASESVTYTVNATVLSSATGNLINTANATLSLGTDPTPVNNSSTDTDTSDPQSDLAITKTDGVANISAGGTTIYTVRVTNNGPSDVTGAVLSDAAATGLSKTAVACSATPGQCVTAPTVVQLQSGTFALPVLASGQFYEITITANVTATSGSITNTATVTTPIGTTDPTPANNSAGDTNTVIEIIAVDDVGTTVNGTPGGQSLANVLSNDTLNGNPATLANVNLTQVSTTDPSVTLDVTTGAVNVAPGTPVGNYTVTYQICDQANPTICDTAIVTVPVVVINAVNDTGSTVNGTVGGQSFANVLSNDTLNGNPATLANITLTQVLTTNVGVTLNVADGSVNVAAGTPAGNYTVTYQICDQANSAICDTATVSVPVVVINAVNDTGSTVNGSAGGQSLANVLTNDTLNGNPVTLANITLTQVSTTNAGVTLNTVNGSVNVAPGTSAGNYTVMYQICDQANPTICDTATVNVPVVVINAVNDTGSTVNGATGGTSLANVLSNDTLDGTPATLANITLTQVSTTNPGVTLDVTTGAVNVAAGTPAGNYTVTYQICDQANPTICDTATVSVPVSAAPINAVDDVASGVNGITGVVGVLNVFNNDTLNGTTVVPSEVTLTETVADPSGALTLNPDGSVDVAPGTATGTYQLTYRICEVLNPTNCDTAIARVTVGLPPAPVAQDDSTTTPFNTPATLATITANDTAFGTGNSILINTIDLDPATAGQQTSYTDSSGNQWSVNITTGDVAFTPSTNYTGTAVIPYSVQDASAQTAAANLSVTVGPPASISGVVFNDADLNGTKSGSEPGINTVKVDLYDSTGITLIASVTTTAGGAYSFPNLTAGTYIIIETDPAGYVSSTPNSVSATISAGGSATVNFGDYQLPNTALSAVNGTVFNDANVNGIQDAGETPLSGVTVQLRNNAGTVIATTTTNAAGGYSFPNLNAGTYTVTETDPVGYISTTLNNVAVSLSAGTIATVNFGDQTGGTATIADPAITKLGSPTTATVGSIVVYTITVGNNGNANAANVILTDTKPTFLDIISITISPNPGLTPVISGNAFTINFGTVTPTDSYTVTVVTRVNSLGVPPGGANNVSLTTSSATDRAFNNSSSAALQIPSNNPGGNPRPSLLPNTGFAPGVVTDLSHALKLEYAAVGDIVLEIPSLGVKLPVVGVPQKNGVWDVTWLGKQAGWLEGTAFPSWVGNSVLTSHVYLFNGLPGPFVNLNKLKYGDQIIVHAYGEKYIFAVRTNQLVEPGDKSAFKHEEKSWLTLVTCKEYDEKTDTYKKRVVVRAVLVRVDVEK